MLLLPRCGSLATAARCSASATLLFMPPTTRSPVRATAQLRERSWATTTNKSPSGQPRPRRPGGAPSAPRSSVTAAASSPSPPPPPASPTVLLKVEGMVCSKCTDRVENALMATDGVKDARADLRGEVRVELVGGAAAAPSAEALAAAVEELGFGAVVAS